MKLLRTLILAFVVTVGVMTSTAVSVRAQEKVFTATELAQFDGQGGRKAYFAYKGKVYDVSESTLWKLGEHFGVKAGMDLTGLMGSAPHGDEVMAKVPLIGTFGTASAEPAAKSESLTPNPSPLTSERSWYDSPIRFLGISVLGWTGILLGVVFVLNFFTCFALPWSKLPVPWAGSRPGADALDRAPVHKNLASIHKYFAWATVVIGILHGVIGFLQVFLKTYL